MTDIESFRTEGLGDSSYLLTHDNLALLVDPQRDFERFLAAVDGAEVRWVLETHIHNDYVSGGRAAARATGAELVFPAGAAPAFRHTPAFHNEDLTEGSVAIRPLHTPGHTPEHTSYLVLVDDEELAVFSGGSLLVGSAGRSDLLGLDRTETMTRLQYGSVNRLATLPDRTRLYPTHGAGSFCAAPGAGATHTSTVGEERRTNPVLSHQDVEEFVTAHTRGLQPYPSYYARMGPINLAGPDPMPALKAPAVDPGDIEATATIVDLRPARTYADGHLPGSINIPLSDQFGTWFGWLIDPASEPILVVHTNEELNQALLQLARIGIDAVAGAVMDAGGTGSVTTRTAIVPEVPPEAQILDVRSPGERADIAPEGTVHRYLPDLMEGPPDELDPSHPVWVMCGGGYRSAIGASVLRHHGFEAIAVLNGGIGDL